MYAVLKVFLRMRVLFYGGFLTEFELWVLVAKMMRLNQMTVIV